MCDIPKSAMKITFKPSFEPYNWHVSQAVVRTILKRHYPKDISGPWCLFFCERCVVSKSLNRRTPGAESGIARDKPMDLFVTDVAGPFEEDLIVACFLLTFQNHASTYTFVAILKFQAEVPGKILGWLENLKISKGRYPKFIQINNAAEYIGLLRQKLDPLGV